MEAVGGINDLFDLFSLSGKASHKSTHRRVAVDDLHVSLIEHLAQIVVCNFVVAKRSDAAIGVRIVKLDGEFAGKLLGLMAVRSKRNLVPQIQCGFDTRATDGGNLDVFPTSSLFFAGFGTVAQKYVTCHSVTPFK